MQRPDTDKQQEILQRAARLFASRPYHEVRLEDVAAAARVGKGTLYIYYAGKEALYAAIIRDGFERIVARIREQLTCCGNDPWLQLGAIAGGLIDFAFTFPDLYHVMKSGVLTTEDAGLLAARRQLTDEIERVIRNGNAAGLLDDPSPELTAQYVLGFVRGVALHPPEGITRQSLQSHILRLLRRGIAAGGAA